MIDLPKASNFDMNIIEWMLSFCAGKILFLRIILEQMNSNLLLLLLRNLQTKRMYAFPHSTPKSKEPISTHPIVI